MYENWRMQRAAMKALRLVTWGIAPLRWLSVSNLRGFPTLVRNGLRREELVLPNNKCCAPINWDNDNPKPFPTIRLKRRCSKEIDQDIVVNNLDPNVSV